MPADADAFVTLHLATPDGWDEVASTYAANAATAPAVFDLQGRYPPGHYAVVAELYLGIADEPLTLRRDFSIIAAPVTLTLDQAEVAPGADLPVRFAGMAGGSRDYVLIAPAGSAPDR